MIFHHLRLHTIKKRVLKNTVLAMLVAIVSIVNAHAKVIAVEAGIANLRAAIDSAEDGDTLVLASGSYTVTAEGGHLYIDKSLHIRGADAQNKPVLSFLERHDLKIGVLRNCDEDGDFSVTLQGLYFYGVDVPGSLIEVEKNEESEKASCLDNLNIIENELDNISIASWASQSSFATYTVNDIHLNNLNVIGNTLNNGVIYGLANSHIYIAYNNITGHVWLRSPSNEQVSYIIGNQIECAFNNSNAGYPQYVNDQVSTTVNQAGYSCLTSNMGVGYTIANRVSHKQAFSSTTRWHHTINVGGGLHYVFNNLITTVESNQPNTFQDAVAIRMGGIGRIANNTIIHANDLSEVTRTSAAIHSYNQFAKIYNNIVVNSPYAAVLIDTDDEYPYVSNNLCYNAEEDSPCNTDYNTITEDPLLDADTYALGEESPAIDAGFDDKYYYDLDGSIGDLGIYGGPYGFSQYQSQREDSSKPFVLPLFHNIGYVPGDTVQAKAIVIPRMK